MKLPYYHIDAFSSSLFSGNPAGVCLLDSWLDDTRLLAIAAENNLPETAFLVKKEGNYELRWFTPQIEVDLCGHATLASAFVILNYAEKSANQVSFASKSGILTVTKENDLLAMDFPSREAISCSAPKDLINALGIEPKEVLRSRDYLVVYENEEQIKALQPSMDELIKVDTFGIIVTSKGSESDFVSRFFAPRAGIPEDPVTGSAHCTLTPYWANELKKTNLHAFQLSKRGGELFCTDAGDRVRIAGKAITYLEGTIVI